MPGEMLAMNVGRLSSRALNCDALSKNEGSSSTIVGDSSQAQNDSLLKLLSFNLISLTVFTQKSPSFMVNNFTQQD